MAEEIERFVGIDWASQTHQVCLVDAHGECLGERAVAHGGPGIEELCDWLITRTGATPEVIGVAIEMTQKPRSNKASTMGPRVISIATPMTSGVAPVRAINQSHSSSIPAPPCATARSPKHAP